MKDRHWDGFRSGKGTDFNLKKEEIEDFVKEEVNLPPVSSNEGDLKSGSNIPTRCIKTTCSQRTMLEKEVKKLKRENIVKHRNTRLLRRELKALKSRMKLLEARMTGGKVKRVQDSSVVLEVPVQKEVTEVTETVVADVHNFEDNVSAAATDENAAAIGCNEESRQTALNGACQPEHHGNVDDTVMPRLQPLEEAPDSNIHDEKSDQIMHSVHEKIDKFMHSINENIDKIMYSVNNSEKSLLDVMHEIISLKKELQTNNQSSEALRNNIFLQKFPLDSIEELQEVDSLLTLEENRTVLIRYLGSIGGQGVQDAGRRTLERILSHSFSQKLSWTGRSRSAHTKEKIVLQNTELVKCLLDAWNDQYMATEKETEIVIRNWLKNAPDRHGGRTARKRSASQAAGR